MSRYNRPESDAAESSRGVYAAKTNSKFEAAHMPEMGRSAARELASFLAAVVELYGAAQVHHAADDWLDEFAAQQLHEPGCDWSITIAAAARLSHRLNGSASNYLSRSKGWGGAAGRE